MSRDGGRSYPAGCERALSGEAPAAPAAVLLFDAAAEARCLAADFDVSRGGQAQVDADAAAFAELIQACGGRTFADRSPTGGRHVYVLWTRPRPIVELRPLMRALGTLYPSLDPAPMLNPVAGCIRPPGARHRTGGHQLLTTAHVEALRAVREPCGPLVWDALLDRLAPCLDPHSDPTDLHEAAPATGPSAGLGARLSDRVERIARTGTIDPDRYASPSEARQAVVTAAAAAGWSLTDLAARIERGLWPGLAGLYARYAPRNRRVALARDWRKARDFLRREKSVRNSSTRGWGHSGGQLGPYSSQSPNAIGDEAEYRWIRAWWNATHATERTRWNDRAGLSKRLVLRALGAMAQRNGTRVLDVGCRGLALASGLDDSTVAGVLRALREEQDPVLELLESGVGERADRYTLRIPDAGLHAAAWRRWRAGRIEAVHPVFRELGPTRALVYEALSHDPLPRRAIAHDAVLSPSTVDDALVDLAAHGLVERIPHEGWRLGPVHPDRLARTLGVDVLVERIVQRYRIERAAWRALLERRRDAHRPPMLHPSELLAWPAEPEAPPPRDADEHAYDVELACSGAGDDSVTAAVGLLERQLGATVLSG
ncbi:MAG: hypothetical protein ACT4QF_20660 [Sporichthyaceae bacterium]